MPQLRAAYARGLFKTAEFLADSDRRLPALACGAGEARFLKERLLMIIEQGKSRTLSRTQRVALTLLAVGLLVFIPTWADRVPRDDAGNNGDAIDSSKRIVELEQRAQLLERELEVERELTTRMLEVDRQRLESERRRKQMSNALQAEEAARMLGLRARELEMHRAQKVERQAEMELERERDSQSEAELLLEQIEFLKHKLEAVQKNNR